MVRVVMMVLRVVKAFFLLKFEFSGIAAFEYLIYDAAIFDF